MIQREPTIDELVNAYNRGDARAFANLFTENAPVYEHPNRLTQRGREELFGYYQQVFSQYPANRTEVLHRIIVGNRVIDHERVSRGDGEGNVFDVVTIYQIRNGLIERLDFVRDNRHVAQVAKT
jgi:hypothetical protein